MKDSKQYSFVRKNVKNYTERFKFIDELIIVEKFSEILNQEIQEKLKQQVQY